MATKEVEFKKESRVAASPMKQSVWQANAIARQFSSVISSAAFSPSKEDNEEPKEVPKSTARSIFAYTKVVHDEISFPADAEFTDVEKYRGGWWKGTYG
jgi:hypothetical protein